MIVYKNIGSWREELREPLFYNIALDLHFLDLEPPILRRNVSDHVGVTQLWANTIRREALTRPIIGRPL